MVSIDSAFRLSKVSIVINMALAGIKIAAGVVGNSYVLVADGIESLADVFSSFVVWSGLRLSVLPADENHPYGHGKAEAVAAIIVSFVLLGAAALIAVRSVHEILSPQGPPEKFTLAILVGVIVIKELLFRKVLRTGESLASTALQADAWHHRSDALTSLAAFIGISISLIGGKGFEAADDWAALVACAVISWNGVRLLRPAVDEIMDAAVAPEINSAVRALAAGVEGVEGIEKCRIRKAGLQLALDIHVIVNGDLSVRRGHAIAHEVVARLRASPHRIHDVTVHIEPDRI